MISTRVTRPISSRTRGAEPPSRSVAAGVDVSPTKEETAAPDDSFPISHYEVRNSRTDRLGDPTEEWTNGANLMTSVGGHTIVASTHAEGVHRLLDLIERSSAVSTSVSVS
jgi:hypothetical protein